MSKQDSDDNNTVLMEDSRMADRTVVRLEDFPRSPEIQITYAIDVENRLAPIRRSERSVWGSSLPDSFNNVMAVVKREISCLNFFRIVTCISLQYNMDHLECRR